MSNHTVIGYIVMVNVEDFLNNLVTKVDMLVSDYNADVIRAKKMADQCVDSGSTLFRAVFINDDFLDHSEDEVISSIWVFSVFRQRLRSAYWLKLAVEFKFDENLPFDDYIAYTQRHELNTHHVFDDFTKANIEHVLRKHNIKF